MKEKINLPESEFSNVQTLFIKGLKKQLNEFSGDMGILENYSPDENYLNSLISYLEELKEVSSVYEFKNILKLSELVYSLLIQIREKEIFSNHELKITIDNIFNELTSIKNSDSEISFDKISVFENKVKELMRKNKIIENKKIDFKNLKINFDFQSYEEIMNEYKNIIIIINRLVFLIEDIKKIKSKTKDKELLEKINYNFSSFTNMFISIQQRLQEIYYQPIKELYQIIESTLSKNGMDVNIQDYSKEIKINPEIFLTLYNSLPIFFNELYKIEKQSSIQIITDEFNEDVKISIIINSPKNSIEKICVLINEFREKNKIEILNSEIENSETRIMFNLKFQNVIYYL